MALTKITGNEIESSTVISAQSFIVSGMSTVGSLSIGNTSVISSNHQLQNISSIDATTTATIESALTNAPITFTDFNVTGNSTLGVTSTANLTSQSLSVSGISTFINGPVFIGSATSTGIASQRLQVTGGGYVSGSLGIGTSNPQYKLDVNGTIFGNSTITGTQLISNIATGTAPFAVTSTTQVSNLNVQYLNGYSSDTANTANAIVRRDASGNFSVGTITAAALTVSGDLTVNGTTTTINSTTVTVDDKNIELGSVASPTDVTADGGGITLKGATDKTFNWVSSTAAWTSSEDFNLATGKVYEIAGTTVLSASQVLGKSMPSGSVVGTADTQTLTNKTIAAGSNTISGLTNSNLSGTAGITNANLANYTISGVALGSNLSTLTMGVSGTGLSGSTTYNGSGAATFTVASNATSANTVSTIVARDASGNFTAGTISAALTGNVTGNVSGSSGSVANAATFNSGGAGAASGTTFNGSAAQTISYNTIGASPLAGSSSLTTTGTVTSGTWSGSFGAVSGANLTGLTAGNLSGTIPSGVLGNSTHYIGTTAIALNRASASQSLTGINIDGSSGSCTGNAATATTATNLSGGSVAATTGTFSNYLRTLEQVRATGWYGTPTGSSYTGLGVEIGMSAGQGYLICYNRNTSAYGILNISNGGATIQFPASGSTINVTGAISGNSTITGTQLISNIATGTAPLTVTSTTQVNNLNSNYLNGITATQFFNNMGNNHSTRTDFNASTNFGFNYIQGTTNGPGIPSAAQYYNLSIGLGNDYAYSLYAMEFAIPRTPSGGNPYPSVRFREGGTWGSWSKIYAGYADSAPFDGLTSKASGSGTYTTSGDFRAPIFYDSNNTGYYTDPASTSNLNALTANSTFTVNNGWSYVANNYGYGIVGLYSASIFQLVFAMGDAYKTTAAGGINNLYGIAWSHPNAGGIAANLNDHGMIVAINGGYAAAISSSIRCATDMRAPLYYDSNNTGYYTDPASTSVMNQINLAGVLRRTTSAAGYLEGNYPTGVDGNSSSAIYTIGGSYQPGGTNLGNMYGCGYTVGNGTANPGLGSGGWGFYVASGGTSRIFLDSDTGYGIASNSWRAPIFYDSNDTLYYIDPASTSKLINVQVTTFGVGTAASGTTGEIRATNNVTAYYSDERLKENITTISSALSKLLTLRGVTFNSNEIAEQYGYTDKKEQVGVIAQDVEKVLPQVVVPAPFDIAQDEDGNEYSKSGENYKTVHYDKLVPLLIEAIKELKGEIEELKLKIPV